MGIERWKWIAGYEHRYEVSDKGSVRSLLGKSPRILKPGIAHKYAHVTLSGAAHDKMLFRVHRLVLAAFVGPCPLGMQCAHLDGNPSNNSVDNLRWVTPKENASHKIAHGTVRGYVNGVRKSKTVKCVKINVKTYKSLRIIGDKLLDEHGCKPTLSWLIDMLLINYQGKKKRKAKR